MHNCIISSCITAVCLTLKKSSTLCVARNVSVSIFSIYFFGFFWHWPLTKKADEIRPLTTANQQVFSELVAVTDMYLDKNGRRYVDLKSLFGFMERIKI